MNGPCHHRKYVLPALMCSIILSMSLTKYKDNELIIQEFIPCSKKQTTTQIANLKKKSPYMLTFQVDAKYLL